MINQIEKRKSQGRMLCFRMAAILAFVAATSLAQGETTTTTTTTTTSGGSSFSTSGGDPFSMGETVLFAGLSAGTIGVYGSSLLPPLHIGLDHAFHQYMSIGGVFGFSRYDYSSDDLTYLLFAARGTFHPTMWFSRMRIPLDPYGVATVGYTQANWSGPGHNHYSYLVIGPSVGARYWFAPNFGGQAEAGLGYGVNLASIGISFKF
ncbi:MAG: hypothetical protein JWO30_2892 [Fibrobacteres bacterium]|nr:hypothetical protein [Fibrobacterota bacterium]